jgi:DNA-binding MarR family transcriptional regulator
VQLTLAGREIWERISPLYLQVVAQVTHELNPHQIAEAVAVMRQLETGASAWKL